jgi:hypothetical protein
VRVISPDPQPANLRVTGNPLRVTRGLVRGLLPPHTSHLLQPLDVRVFSVYKHWHSEAVEAATAIGVEKI